MTINMAVLIETLKYLSSDLRWCSFTIFSTQYHTESAITHDESAAVFSWKGEILEEYWDWILNALIWPEDYVKGHIPDLIIDDGSELTLISHEGKKVDNSGRFIENSGWEVGYWERKRTWRQQKEKQKRLFLLCLLTVFINLYPQGHQRT